MTFSKNYIAIALLVIFYLVGIFGLSNSEWQSTFLSLTPFNLLLTLGVFFWSNGHINQSMIISFIITFIIGFGVEVAGVHTGVLFGSYQYGTALGLKLFEVPLMIGVNWFLLAISSSGIAEKISPNSYVRIVMASLLMVLLDVLIEPAAIQLDFWSWENGIIPLQNFAMWFITAVVIQLILSKLKPTLNIVICLAVYFIQFVFFGILNLIL
ncbi:MAG: carotenoid biosynthesis protein [Bacteroidia bacterium]